MQKKKKVRFANTQELPYPLGYRQFLRNNKCLLVVNMEDK